MCSVGALRKSDGLLKPYFTNRTSKIKRIRTRLEEIVGCLMPVHHIAGNINHADLGTCGQAKMQDLGPTSVWHKGPRFPRLPFNEWPVTDLEKLGTTTTPVEEVQKQVQVLSVMTAKPEDSTLGSVLTKSLESGDRLGTALQGLVESILEREKLELTTRALARAMNAVLCNDRSKCHRPPSARMIELAVTLLIKKLSVTARLALRAGKFQGLGAVDQRGGIWVSGCVRGEQLAELLGTKALPILMATERLANRVCHKNEI